MAPDPDRWVLTSDGRRLGYAEFGDPAGGPLLCFHGWPGSRWQGHRLHDAALTLGLRIVAPDRPGFGLSSFQQHRALDDWPTDVALLADALGISRFAIFAASGGGPYALACARAMPRRVAAVALASALGPPDTPGLDSVVPWTRRLLIAAGVRGRVPSLLAVRAIARIVHADAGRFLERSARYLPAVDRAIVSDPAYRANAIRDLRAAFADGGRGAVHDVRILTSSWPFTLDQVMVPVHLWYGGVDPLIPPAMGHHLAQSLPNSAAHYLPNEGHYVMVPRAREMLEVLSAER